MFWFVFFLILFYFIMLRVRTYKIYITVVNSDSLMYFYGIAPSRAKLGLAIMELSYTVGLVSKEMTGNNWNSTSRRI